MLVEAASTGSIRRLGVLSGCLWRVLAWAVWMPCLGPDPETMTPRAQDGASGRGYWAAIMPEAVAKHDAQVLFPIA